MRTRRFGSDLKTDEQTQVSPIGTHAMMSIDKNYVIADNSLDGWWRGCAWQICFHNRKTSKDAVPYQASAMCTKNAESICIPIRIPFVWYRYVVVPSTMPMIWILPSRRCRSDRDDFGGGITPKPWRVLVVLAKAVCVWDVVCLEEFLQSFE